MKKVIITLITLFTCLSLTIPCFATGSSAVDEVFLVTIPESGDVSELSALLGTTYTTSTDDYQGYFRVSGDKIWLSDDFNYLSYEKQTAMITELVADLADTAVANITKQAVYTSISKKLDSKVVAYIPDIIEATSADVVGGSSLFAPFRGTLGIILGVGVILIMVVLTTSTILDLAYLGSPGVMNWFLKSSKNDTRRLKLISIDAQNVANGQANGTITGNVYFAYLRRRWVTYIVLGVCVLYLLSGQIAGLIKGMFNVAQGIIN